MLEVEEEFSVEEEQPNKFSTAQDTDYDDLSQEMAEILGYTNGIIFSMLADTGNINGSDRLHKMETGNTTLLYLMKRI